MQRKDVLLGAGAALLAGSAAQAQTFPDRPITITNGYGPGGSTDIAS